jgi:hypothetical protein
MKEIKCFKVKSIKNLVLLRCEDNDDKFIDLDILEDLQIKILYVSKDHKIYKDKNLCGKDNDEYINNELESYVNNACNRLNKTDKKYIVNFINSHKDKLKDLLYKENK